MVKNIIIAILVIAVAVESGYIVLKKAAPKITQEVAEKTNVISSGKPVSKGPQLLMKGMKLSDSPISKFAYKVAPGDLSAQAKTALAGWSITNQTLSDGSLQVTFTPKNSNDQSSQYIVKQGQILYFVEMTPVDDSAQKDTDKNLRDDYGIITDQNGIVQ